MPDLKKVTASIVHIDGSTSMVDIVQGNWPDMKYAVDEAFQRPGAALMFLGTLRIENPNPVPIPGYDPPPPGYCFPIPPEVET